MNIFRLAFELFVIYMVYKLIFEFIIPVYRTTKQMKQKMGEMNQRMQQQEQQQERHASQAPETPKKAFRDDYIDYEEVK